MTTYEPIPDDDDEDVDQGDDYGWLSDGDYDADVDTWPTWPDEEPYDDLEDYYDPWDE